MKDNTLQTYKRHSQSTFKMLDIIFSMNCLTAQDLDDMILAMRDEIVLDFPQKLTAENMNPYKLKAEKYEAVIDTIAQLWGNKKDTADSWHTKVVLIPILVTTMP